MDRGRTAGRSGGVIGSDVTPDAQPKQAATVPVEDLRNRRHYLALFCQKGIGPATENISAPLPLRPIETAALLGFVLPKIEELY
jgi:hypothetical protein